MKKEKKKKVYVELDYPQEDFTLMMEGLNNAIVALNKVYFAARLGCEIPREFYPLFENKSFEEIDELCITRLSKVKELYDLLHSCEE